MEIDAIFVSLYLDFYFENILVSLLMNAIIYLQNSKRYQDIDFGSIF